MDAPLLEIENLCISYFVRAGEIPAVVDFSLRMDAGESVGLVGESGCGKSTVALAIMRYMGHNGGIVGGSIRFKGRELGDLSASELRRVRGAEIAMIYQEPMAALNPSLTIADQLVEVPVTHDGVSRGEAAARAIRLLDDVRLPDPERVMDAYPHQISGGQQQRVVIAMALLSNPSLLLLDEPTTALDVTVEAGIVDLIGEISKKYGTAQLYISHNMGLILQTCERVSIMYSGEVVEEGRTVDVFNDPRHPYTRGLFGCIPLPSCDKNARPLTPIRGQLPLPGDRPRGCYFGPRCDYVREGLCDVDAIPMEPVEPTELMKPAGGGKGGGKGKGGDEDGHHVRCARWREVPAENLERPAIAREPLEVGEEVLRVSHLRKYYPVRDRSIGALISGGEVQWVKANEALDFRARARETVAIVGESGCGKSTFAKVLMGLETATSGELHLDGEDIAQTAVRDRSPAQLGSLQMVFQNPNETLNPSHTVGAQIERVIRKFGVESDGPKVRERVLRLLDIVKLPADFYRRRPRQLSGGQKQRVGIARAFAGNPKVVVADEPISALDVSVAAAVTELLMDIQRDHGTTLLFISHDISTVRYLADRVVVMYLGRIMESGSTDQVFAPPYHPYTEALLSAAPIADPGVEKRAIVLEGSVPSALDPPKGCPFASRCPRKLGRLCDDQPPPQRAVAPNHVIACHIAAGDLRQVEPVFRSVPKNAAE